MPYIRCLVCNVLTENTRQIDNHCCLCGEHQDMFGASSEQNRIKSIIAEWVRMKKAELENQKSNQVLITKKDTEE